MLAVAVGVGLGECVWIVEDAEVSTPFKDIAAACAERHLSVVGWLGSPWSTSQSFEVKRVSILS